MGTAVPCLRFDSSLVHVLPSQAALGNQHAEGKMPGTTAELALQLLKNSEKMDLAETYFKDAVGGLSNIRRTAAFDYVRLLKDRIQLLEAQREAEGREYIASRRAMIEQFRQQQGDSNA